MPLRAVDIDHHGAIRRVFRGSNAERYLIRLRCARILVEGLIQRPRRGKAARDFAKAQRMKVGEAIAAKAGDASRWGGNGNGYLCARHTCQITVGQ